MNTPLGPLTLGWSESGLAYAHFGGELPPDGIRDEAANREAMHQLDEYFAGKRKHFDLTLDLRGTPFQLRVWGELLKIPYGQTRTYGQIAEGLGRRRAARAVGMANHDNPIAIVVPCHRVIGSNGSLTGYAGGIHLKEKLLALEKAEGGIDCTKIDTCRRTGI